MARWPAGPLARWPAGPLARWSACLTASLPDHHAASPHCPTLPHNAALPRPLIARPSMVHPQAQLLILPGDALLAAAFVSYSGCFSKRFRGQLLNSTYLPYLKGEISISKGGVPMSEGADPLTILTTEAERAVWAGEHLPTDRVSVENGAIVCNCARWPLLIDPQLQGITWIKKKEESAKVCRLGQKTLMQNVEGALSGGLPIIIENLGLTYDAVLAPVVGRQIMRRGRATFVKLGDKEVDYEPGFKLYLQTK
eukprot:5947307-Prymnesium_polylepis.1